jgi:tRNA 2-thiocytidine biosynthesis protein TtcA
MFRALMNARPSHLLDPNLFDFAGLTREKVKFDQAETLAPRLH